MTRRVSWPIVPLADVTAETQYGTSEKANESGLGLPMLRMGNITYQGSFDLSDLKYIELRDSDRERYTVRRGDLLFNRTNSQELVGKLGVWDRDEEFAFAGYLIRVRLKPELACPKFVAAYFNTPEMKNQLRTRAKPSINMSNINATELIKFLIPLPPLPEQRRIAAILDQADALRAKRRAALEKLEALAPSLFLEMFGDQVANDRKWRCASIADFVAAFETGKNVVGTDEDAVSEYRVLKVSAVTSTEYRADESKPAPDDYQPPASHFVRAGDLLFSRANTASLIGATAYVFQTPPNVLLPDKIWRFVWHDEPRAHPFFVWHLFRHPRLREEIGKRATGTSSSMKNISQEKVFGLTVGLPPLRLQQEFAGRVSGIEQLKAAQRVSLAKLDALFASLQHRAFRGEL